MKTKLAALSFLAIAIQGCGGFQSNEALIQKQLQDVSLGVKPVDSERPYCELDYVEYEMDARIIEFQITDKSNVGFGFNLLTGFFRALGVKMKTQKGRMQMYMHMSESLRPTEYVAHSSGQGESKSNEFSIDLDLMKLSLDYGYFYQTPLSELTSKTIDNGLSNLQSAMSKVETPWSTRVVYNYPNEGQFIIPTGTVAGIRVGDFFKVVNVDYAWHGEPCTSELLFERRRSETAMAVAKVVQVEKHAALLRITELRSEEPIERGAKVEVSQLVGANRSLNRSVRLRTLQSEPLSIVTDAKIDLSVYLKEQADLLLNRHSYYSRK